MSKQSTKLAKSEAAVKYYSKGNSLAYLGKYAAAIEEYNKATELNPDYADAYNNKGNSNSGNIGNNDNSVNSDASMQYGSSSNNVDSAFIKNLDKLERKIIKLQRCKISGAVDNNMPNNKQCLTNLANGNNAKEKIPVSAQHDVSVKQDQSEERRSRYFELGMCIGMEESKAIIKH